jgi:hypothetical protein
LQKSAEQNRAMSSLTRRLGRRISSTGSELLSDRLKNLDAYPKTLEDFRVKTYTGAASMSVLLVDEAALQQVITGAIRAVALLIDPQFLVVGPTSASSHASRVHPNYPLYRTNDTVFLSLSPRYGPALRVLRRGADPLGTDAPAPSAPQSLC